MILLAAGLINRLLGFIPRVVLPRIIGAEGVGLYQMSYPFFIVLVTLITGGIPLAVSKLVAQSTSDGQRYCAKQILQISLLFTLMLGISFMFLCLFLTKWLCHYVLTDERVYHSFISMSPMIPVVCISSVFRGYFLGKQNMIPSATSLVLETTTRIIFVIWLSSLLLPYGVAKAAAGAMLGTLVGEVVGALVLLWYFHRNECNTFSPPPLTAERVYQTKGSSLLLNKLLRISIPVTASKLVGSLSYLIESIITAQSLVLAGISKIAATAQYGVLQGMIVPLLLLPGALTTSLATSLIPSISEAECKGDRFTTHRRMHQTVKLTLVAGTPFAVLMYVLAQPLCIVLYNDERIAHMLKLMAPFSLFIYAQPPLQAALQALDRPGKALFNTCIGATIKMVCILTLASQPKFGILGAAFAICLNAVIVTLLNGYSIRKLIAFSFPVLDYLKVGANMIVMAAATQWIFNFIRPSTSSWTQCIVCALWGVMCYILMMIGTRTISGHDLHMFPTLQRWLIGKQK